MPIWNHKAKKEENFSIADRVKARRLKHQSVKTDGSMTSSSKLPSSSTKVKSPRKEKKKNDPFLSVISRAIGKLAPKSIYSKELGEKLKKGRDAKKVANIIPDEFRSLLESAESLWVDSEEVKVFVPDPYPTLDWSKINKRFISNIPSPSTFPKHGCSLDPAFYEYTSRFITGNADKLNPNIRRRSFHLGQNGVTGQAKV